MFNNEVLFLLRIKYVQIGLNTISKVNFQISLTENEKENDSRGGQATQAIIQRRRRPKRRSTGVCNVGAEVINKQNQ